MSHAYFPLIVLGIIIDVLIKESNTDAESRILLKSCALLTRIHYPRIQQYFFSEVILSLGRNCTKFSLLLHKNSTLSTYITCLIIDIPDSDTDDCIPLEESESKLLPPPGGPKECAHLTYILNTLTSTSNLEAMLLYSHRSSFSLFPEGLQIALVRRFHLPNLTTLRFVGVENIPTRYIASSTAHLMDLYIRAPAIEDGAVTNNAVVPFIESALVSSGWHPRAGKSRLRHLTVDHPTSLGLFIEKRRHPLKKLCLISVPCESILKILRTAQATLKVLEIKEFDDNSLLDPIQLDLPLLQSITLTTPAGSPPSSAQSLLSLIAFILKGGFSTPYRVLQHLKITLAAKGNPEAIVTYPIWKQIDAALSHPRYAAFATLTLNLTTEDNEGDVLHMRSARQKFYARSVPHLHLDGKIGFEWNGNSIASKVVFDGRLFNNASYGFSTRRR